jgi:hypothetical protein
MSETKAAYPPCAKRLEGKVKGVITHAKCNDQSKDRYRQLVKPVDCQRCITGAEADQPESSGKEADAAPTPEPPIPEPPGLVRRALSYAEALAQWTAAGRPERSDKEVERIFNGFCKPCRWFHRRRKICRGCGCRVADKGFAITNKIKMATEHCPRNLW